MSIPTVKAFQFDDNNTEKFAAHGLTDRQVNQLLGNGGDRMKSNNDSTDLGNLEEWDFERAELSKPAQSRRTVVSVSVSRDDFDQLSSYAERIGMRTSEFIRRAALAHLRKPARAAFIFSASGSGGSMIFTSASVAKTDVWGQVNQELPQPNQAEQAAFAP